MTKDPKSKGDFGYDDSWDDEWDDSASTLGGGGGGSSSSWWKRSSSSSGKSSNDSWWNRHKSSWGSGWSEMDSKSNRNILSAISRRSRFSWGWWSDQPDIETEEPELPEGQLGTSIAVMRGAFKQFSFNRIVGSLLNLTSGDSNSIKKSSTAVLNKFSKSTKDAETKAHLECVDEYTKAHGIVPRMPPRGIVQPVLALGILDRLSMTHPVSHEVLRKWHLDLVESKRMDLIEWLIVDDSEIPVKSLAKHLLDTIVEYKTLDQAIKAVLAARSLLRKATKMAAKSVQSGNKPSVAEMITILGICLAAARVMMITEDDCENENRVGHRAYNQGMSKQMGTSRANKEVSLGRAISGEADEGEDGKGDDGNDGKEYKNHVAHFKDFKPRYNKDAERYLKDTGATEKDLANIYKAIRELEKATTKQWRGRPNKEGPRLDLRTIVRTSKGLNEKPFIKPVKVDPHSIEFVVMFDISGSVSGYVPKCMATMSLILDSVTGNRLINYHPGLYRSYGRLITPEVLTDMRTKISAGNLGSALEVNSLAAAIGEVFSYEGVECPASVKMDSQIRGRGILGNRKRTIFLGVGDGALDSKRLMDSLAMQFDVFAFVNISRHTIEHMRSCGGTDPYHPNGGFGEAFYQCRKKGESIPSCVARAIRNVAQYAVEGRTNDPDLGTPTEIRDAIVP